MTKRALAVIVWSLGALLARTPDAGACPVCFQAGDANVLWFYGLSTMWLSLLPFALIGSIALVALWLRREAGIAPTPERR